MQRLGSMLSIPRTAGLRWILAVVIFSLVDVNPVCRTAFCEAFVVGALSTRTYEGVQHRRHHEQQQQQYNKFTQRNTAAPVAVAPSGRAVARALVLSAR